MYAYIRVDRLFVSKFTKLHQVMFKYFTNIFRPIQEPVVIFLFCIVYRYLRNLQIREKVKINRPTLA